MVRKIIWWILTVCCMALILGFSLQSVSDSIHLSGTITDIVLEQNTAYKELPPASQKVENDLLHDKFRNGAHIAIFAALAFCASMLIKCYTQKWWVAVSLPSCLVFAVLDECIQQWHNAGRTFELADIYRDWQGVLIGIAVALVVAIVSRIYYRRKLEESSHGVSGTGAG